MSVCVRFGTSIALGALVSLVGLGLAAVSQQPATGSEFRASDGSFTCPVPAGWTVRTVPLGGTPVHVFEPAGGGEDRIIVASGPSPAGTIQELTQYSMAFVSQQLLPGVQPVKLPAFGQTGGAPSAEVYYQGMTGAGQVSWWQGILLKDQMYFTVLGGARADRAAQVEKDSRTIFAGIRPAPPQPNSQLAAAIVGSWSFYDRSNLTRGSSSKQVTFYPNGRFEYVAATYLPNLPADVDPTTRIGGQYRLNGNTLVVQMDNGQSATYTLQLVQGGGLMINGEMFIRER
jgi:hypothetical protein